MKLFLSVIFAALVLVWAGGAQAADNAAAGGSSAASAAGTCSGPCVLGPNFDAVGESAEYRVQWPGPNQAWTATAEDGCVAGDLYQLSVKRFLSNGTDTTNGSSVAGCTCTYTGLVVDDASVTVKGFGAAKVKLKSIALPGGIPATAYVSFSKGTVTQTAGTDSCQ